MRPAADPASVDRLGEDLADAARRFFEANPGRPFHLNAVDFLASLMGAAARTVVAGAELAPDPAGYFDMAVENVAAAFRGAALLQAEERRPELLTRPEASRIH